MTPEWPRVGHVWGTLGGPSYGTGSATGSVVGCTRGHRRRGAGTALAARRPGFVGWRPGGDWDLVLAPLGWLVNWLTNIVAFRCGWTVYVVDDRSGRTVEKQRYASRSVAVADLPRLRAVHGVRDQEEPPTR